MYAESQLNGILIHTVTNMYWKSYDICFGMSIWCKTAIWGILKSFIVFYLISESGSLLQLLLEGNYEAILLSEAVQNIFTVPAAVKEEKFDSSLEKQIQAYLDCSSVDVDNVER